jgi:anthranilate phosphoribosyltransferase
MPLHDYLKRIVEQRETLSRDEAHTLLQEILAGHTDASTPGSPHSLQLAALLGAITARGESSAELAGFVDAMRAAAISLPLTEAERTTLVDTCGTGGDASDTFNISTAAALIAAAAGATVAKHGNRAVTSKCGSADVLEALGIPVTLSPDAAAAALRTHRFAFLHAPSLHPAMKAVMPIRRALGVRTVFNVLGPLANPAGARAQIMGVYSAHLVPLVAEAMRQLGVRHAFVVHGNSGAANGMDELSVSGASQIAEVRDGEITFSADILRALFTGQRGPRRDIALLNAAAVLITAGLVPASSSGLAATIRSGIELAAKTVDSGAVTDLVAALARTEP